MVSRTFKRITITAQTWFAKPLNNSSGKKTFLMRGGEMPYQYAGKTNVKVGELEDFIEENKERIISDLSAVRARAAKKSKDKQVAVKLLKEDYGITRMAKGLRGGIRHSIMELLYHAGIDYCSPTTKKAFGSKEPTLLEREHLMGGCGDNPCPIRQLFGIMGEESVIRTWSDVLLETEDLSLERLVPQKGVAFIHASMEKRHAARRDKKVLQDFSEQYFGGTFNFYVEFSEDIPKWLLGLLVKGILGISHIGGGSNSGYGRMELQEITLEEISSKKVLGEEKDGKIAIVKEEQTEQKNELLQEALNAWEQYLKTRK
ncbi:MAG: hypothetical protein GF308_00615 [Candidatus Heimdallarchaeota archaeon]|nr:hypothetical protein [Candidatus Heimdallarchaeota archaeon]